MCQQNDVESDAGTAADAGVGCGGTGRYRKRVKLRKEGEDESLAK